MKILLTTLNSKYIHSNLALKYLYESAGIYRDLLEVKEFTINHDEMSVFLEIMRGDYDVICFSCYIWNGSQTISLIQDIKKAAPGVKIIVGGPEASYEPEGFLERCPEVDLILQGEGDVSFPMVLQQLAEGSWGFAAKIVEGRTPMAGEIPFPYANSEIDPNKIVYYESARGCPYRCSFCLSSESHGVRLLPLERVERELAFFLEKGLRQVKFVDRTFNLDMERAAAIMNFLIEQDNGVTNFHFELCGDRISEEMLEAFGRSRCGLFQVEIGVQSACPRALEACGRNVDFQKLKENVKRILAGNNVHVHLDLIAGLPYETYEIFADSFNQVYGMDPQDLQLGFLKLIKGTKLRREAEKYGYVYRDRQPYEIISNDYISGNELLRLKMVEQVLELYYNKPGFRTALKYLLAESGKTPFQFYTELAGFYYENNYHTAALHRDRLYEILLDFACQKGWGEKECLSELLLYDKIAIAGPSRFAVQSCADLVHQHLRRNQTEKEVPGQTAKARIRCVNYMKFYYNVEEYDRQNASLKRNDEARLLIFYPHQKDAGEKAACERIKTESGGIEIGETSGTVF